MVTSWSFWFSHEHIEFLPVTDPQSQASASGTPWSKLRLICSILFGPLNCCRTLSGLISKFRPLGFSAWISGSQGLSTHKAKLLSSINSEPKLKSECEHTCDTPHLTRLQVSPLPFSRNEFKAQILLTVGHSSTQSSNSLETFCVPGSVSAAGCRHRSPCSKLLEPDLMGPCNEGFSRGPSEAWRGHWLLPETQRQREGNLWARWSQEGKRRTDVPGRNDSITKATKSDNPWP